MPETHVVTIIGAGLSGLTAAHHLVAASTDEQPIEVLVVDKARSVGGRLATRRIGDATLDHGAQFFTVRTEDFGNAVQRWKEGGLVDEWCHGFSEHDGYPRYRTAGGMNALAKHVAAELSESPAARIVTRQRANAIIPGPEQWAVAYEAATREPDEADAVIVTAPVPQTLELFRAGATVLAPDVTATLEAMRYHKVIAALAVLDQSPELPEPGALQRPDHPMFTFVADNQAKGISGHPAVTFHLSHSLSEQVWDADDAAVLAEIDEELQATIGPATVTEVQIKRWRYAGPVSPHPEPALVAATTPGPLVLAGDGFGTSKVEGAFLSGLAAAKQVLSALTDGATPTSGQQ
jgi:predicted NAD/FAD-dependent oxidoreductase